MNTELFTGKAAAYAAARPGYPNAAVEYILSQVPPNAVFADIGAGTGIFTALLAKRDFDVYAVEPNADMLTQLRVTLKDYHNVKIFSASAEETTLPAQSVDAIICAQALHWFDPVLFAAECRRIGKPDCKIFALYNNTPGQTKFPYSKSATDIFFTNPIIKEFPNPIFYTREKWLAYMTSHSHNPLPSDLAYAAHIAEANAIFDHENLDGLLRRDVTTKIYCEKTNL